MNEFEKLLSSLGLGMDAEKHTVVDRDPNAQAEPKPQPEPQPQTESTADDRAPVDPEDPWKRDAMGRFGKGNKGGPGNPYAREVAARQKQILEFYDEEKTDELLSILHEMVLQRDKTAIRIVTSYVFNKLAPPVHPDQVDYDEFLKWKQEKEMWDYVAKEKSIGFSEEMMHLLRLLRKHMGDEWYHGYLEFLVAGSDADTAEIYRLAKEHLAGIVPPHRPATGSEADKMVDLTPEQVDAMIELHLRAKEKGMNIPLPSNLAPLANDFEIVDGKLRRRGVTEGQNGVENDPQKPDLNI